MLSVIIITKNEELNIRHCLESIDFADEIIVLDSGSTDNTIAIAKEFTKHVYINDDWQGYGIQKQRALSFTTGEWVLNLDADETVDAKLKKEVLDAITTDKADAYRVPIRMNFYGKPLNNSSSPNRHVRLFKRDIAKFSTDIVHEKIILKANSRIKKLSSPIMHHSFQDVSHALYKTNRYSSYSAKIRAQKSIAPSFVNVLLSTSWMFVRCYILQRGFLDGRTGFLMATLNAHGTFYRGIKQIYPDLDKDNLPNVIE